MFQRNIIVQTASSFVYGYVQISISECYNIHSVFFSCLTDQAPYRRSARVVSYAACRGGLTVVDWR